MEDADFVADSDEDEQERQEEQALEEERRARERLERASGSSQEDAQVVTTMKEVTVEEQQEHTVEEHKEESDGEQDGDSVMAVGTLVQVDARTWPGINKQGGAGRVFRVHREMGADGQSEDISYDVRYVLGGFEKHIESEFVHSSELLNQQSNREIIDREYYAEQYIDKPFLEKQQELEKRRVNQPTSNATTINKRKRSHRTLRDQSVSDDKENKGPNDEETRRSKARKLDENSFIFTNNTSASLENSSKPSSGDDKSTKTIHSMQSPPVKKPSAGRRRRNLISDSSDEESRAGDDDNGDNRSVSPAPQDQPDSQYEESLNNEGGEEVRNNIRPVHQHQRRSQKHKSRRRRYVGGYEHSDNFIQPEGNPADLPDDVLRETGIKLATTKKKLMVQLQEIFDQQKKHMADFHKEQTLINQRVMKLEQIPSSELQSLYKKVKALKTFVTKTLVNAGEDLINRIIELIKEKRGKTPAALEGIEISFDQWQRELNDCNPWVRYVTDVVRSAMDRRNEAIPQEDAAQDGYSSDSGESSNAADNYDRRTLRDETKDSVSDENDFSYDYVPPEISRTDVHRKSQFTRASTTNKHQLKLLKATTKQKHRKKLVSSMTLDDFFPRGEASGFRPNLRLIGRQKNILPSDPRFNWVKLACNKQKRTSMRTPGTPSMRVSSGVGQHVNDQRPKSWQSRDDSISVQAKRIHLRNQRFRGQSTQKRDRFFARSAPQNVDTKVQTMFPASIHFDDVSFDKKACSAEPVVLTNHQSISKQQPVNWETIFEAAPEISDRPEIGDNYKTVPRQVYEELLTFGYPICGPLVPQRLLSGETLDIDDSERFRDVVARRTARIHQLLNDLRLRENDFMDSLSRGGLGNGDEEGYSNTSEWIALVSMEEAFHVAVASFFAQLCEALETVSPTILPAYVRTVLTEVSTLIRQLPDCEALFGYCKAYFFFFEVASRDAATTPLLTAISRCYWYSLTGLATARSTCARVLGQDGTANQEVENLFKNVFSFNTFILAGMLFLFDLHLYLPSSHRLNNNESDTFSMGPRPALSLWLMIRVCCTSPIWPNQSQKEKKIAREKDFWLFLQAAYQSHFDELARCFVRSESCGGYLREFTQTATNENFTEQCEEVLESKLLALESTWDLLAVLSRVFVDEELREHEGAVSKVRWAFVIFLLHPENRDFLPFKVSTLQTDFLRRADTYKLRVLKRITTLSKQLRPNEDIIKSIFQQLWENDTPSYPDDILELPMILKQFIIQCKELGNSPLPLTAFAEATICDEHDATTELCKIIWIQFLKLEKRIFRSRFRTSVLNSIPSTVNNRESSGVALSGQLQQKSPGSNWVWDPKQRTEVSVQTDKLVSGSVLQPTTTIPTAGKERMSTAVLLTFAVLDICKECGDERQFPNNRSLKDIRNMERSVDFYCNEILRWTAEKPACEVLAAQGLYVLGALLLEKNSTEFPIVFRGLNEKLSSSVKNLEPAVASTLKELPGATATSKFRDLEKRRRRLRCAAMTSLYQMRDLVRKLVEMPSSGVIIGDAFAPAANKSLEHVFSTGLKGCLGGASQKVVADHDLKVVMEIFQLVLPRARDEPTRSTSLPTSSEFREYDDIDDILMGMDLDECGVVHNSPPKPAWTAKDSESTVIQLIISNLRVALQQLVLNYPQTEGPEFDELYAIDLLGMILSSCEVQFFWSNVTSKSAKARKLAPRILSAAIKYNPQKEWLGNAFLRESGSDHDLATAWMLATLDASSLNSEPISFKPADVPFSIFPTTLPQASSGSEEVNDRVRDSDCWVMLTDGIIYHMLRKDPVGLYTMDLQILEFLRGAASVCKFPKTVRDNNENLHDSETLYDLHLDVFQSFCKSARSVWCTYNAEPEKHRHQMNQFRVKMMHSQSGIYASFLEAYKLNFRRSCSEIDEVNHDWHSFAQLFLIQAGVNAKSGRSYHQMDDTVKNFDERLAGLTTMFRFMYQCMDAFLYYCGELAIGGTNPLFDAMGLLFRQVVSAEFPQAIKRLKGKRTFDQRNGVRDLTLELQKGFDTQAMGFVDSVQLFFARQKYPSLLHWFAQTSEIYQTFKSGWGGSPLQTLLVNILDPHGPLGIHSYYPDDEGSHDAKLNVDVKTVRREAFYLSCGLFVCKCTRSFEHSRSSPSPESGQRLKQLRVYVLNDFMHETFEFALKEGTLMESMVPLFQLTRAVLNHANLNACSILRAGASGFDSTIDDSNFQLSELHPCLEWMIECLIKVVPAEEVVNSSISCVLLAELCGIMCETIEFNERRPLLELIDLVKLALSYLQRVYVALAKRTAKAMKTLFASIVEYPPSAALDAHGFTSSKFRYIVVKQGDSLGGLRESYGFTLARATTDLLSAITRVAEKCKTSSDERLRSFTAEFS